MKRFDVVGDGAAVKSFGGVDGGEAQGVGVVGVKAQSDGIKAQGGGIKAQGGGCWPSSVRH